MRRFMRRVNRGLVLFVLLCIGFVTFAVIQTVSFKSEKNDIANLCADFCKQTGEVMTTPESCYKASNELTAEQKSAVDAKIDEYSKLWENIEPPEKLEYCTNLTKMQECLKKSLYFNAGFNGYIESAIFSIDKNAMNIRMLSDNFASASFECEYTLTHTNYVRVAFSNDCDELYAGANQPMYYYFDDKYYDQKSDRNLTEAEFKKATEQLEDSKSKTHITTEFTVYFKKTDGKWRIAYINAFPNETATVEN